MQTLAQHHKHHTCHVDPSLDDIQHTALHATGTDSQSIFMLRTAKSGGMFSCHTIQGVTYTISLKATDQGCMEPLGSCQLLQQTWSLIHWKLIVLACLSGLVVALPLCCAPCNSHAYCAKPSSAQVPIHAGCIRIVIVLRVGKMRQSLIASSAQLHCY